MREELATEVNFEENAYLSANPDVLQAIQKGLFTSGREHFERFGVKEERKIHVKPSPADLREMGFIDVHQRIGSLSHQDVIRIRFFTAYDYCNFSCEYCIVGQNHKELLEHNFDASHYLQIVEAITKLPFSIDIRLGVAGEFFLNQFLIDGGRILSNAKNVRHLNLITNLSFDYPRYIEFFEGYDHSKLAIVASYHPTQVKDKRKWLDTALQMSKEFDFAVVLIAYPPILKQLPSLVKELKDAGHACFVQGFIGTFETKEYPYSYTAEDKSLLRTLMYSRHDFEFLINARKPGLCNAGYKSLYITKNGDVFSCGAGKGIKLGNLLEDPDLYFFDSYRPCHHNSCLCDTENMNTVIFEDHYELSGKNQHKYTYKFERLAKDRKDLDEWEIGY